MPVSDPPIPPCRSGGIPLFWKYFAPSQWSEMIWNEWYGLDDNNTTCCPDATMPPAWQWAIINIYSHYLENPSGVWADFNYLYRLYLYMIDMSNQGVICVSEIPDPPNPCDYSDLTSPATIFADDGSWTCPYLGDTIGITYQNTKCP